MNSTTQELLDQLVAQIPTQPDNEVIIAAIAEARRTMLRLQLQLLIAAAPDQMKMRLSELLYGLDQLIGHASQDCRAMAVCEGEGLPHPRLIRERAVELAGVPPYDPMAEVLTGVVEQLDKALISQRNDILTGVEKLIHAANS